MPSTYTPPTGNTIPAAQLQALQAALPGFSMPADAGQALQGYTSNSAQAANMTAQMPQFQQQAQQSASQQANIPQATQTYGNLADMYKLFLMDHNLSQQFTRPDMQQPNTPTQQSSDVPTYGSVGAPQMPELTLDSLSKGFQGFTNPADASTAGMQQGQGILGVLNNLSNYISNQNTWATTQSTAASQTQQAKINALMQLAGVYGNIWSTQQSLSAPGSTGYNQNLESQVQSDVKKGLTLQDLLLKWRSQVDPNSIYGIYNTIHSTDKVGSKGSSGWGTAKESAQQLAQLGITGAPVTQAAAAAKNADKNKVTAQASSDAYSSLSKLKEAYNKFLKTKNPNDLRSYKQQEQIFGDKLAYALNKSRANASVTRVVNTLPDPANPLNAVMGLFGGNPFDGVESQLSIALPDSYTPQASTPTQSNYKIIQVQ